MSDDERDPDGSDDILDDLERAKNDAINDCHYRTACRLAAEIKRKARAARRLKPYVWALHTLTNQSGSLLDPEQGRESAVELIAVLESEDRARQIQPDLDIAEYESTRLLGLVVCLRQPRPGHRRLPRIQLRRAPRGHRRGHPGLPPHRQARNALHAFASMRPMFSGIRRLADGAPPRPACGGAPAGPPRSSTGAGRGRSRR